MQQPNAQGYLQQQGQMMPSSMLAQGPGSLQSQVFIPVVGQPQYTPIAQPATNPQGQSHIQPLVVTPGLPPQMMSGPTLAQGQSHIQPLVVTPGLPPQMMSGPTLATIAMCSQGENTAAEKNIQDAVMKRYNKELDFTNREKRLTIRCSCHNDLVKFWTEVLDHNYRREKIDVKGNLTWKSSQFIFTVYISTGTLVVSGGQGNRLKTINSLIANFESNTPNTDEEDVLVDAFRSLNPLAASTDVWTGEDLEKELELLEKGAVKNGQTFIYKLWNSLLVDWYNTENTKIYIVSPFLDADIFTDIVEIFLSSSHKTNLEALITRLQCCYDKDINNIREQVTWKCSDEDAKKICDHIWPKMEAMDMFHGKFFAAVTNDEAKVIVTSANLTKNHFGCHNYETVIYLKMNQTDFDEHYWRPLLHRDR